MKIRDLEAFIHNINRGLNKIQFDVAHQYGYYTVELFVRDYKEQLKTFIYKCNIYAGSKKECYEFINSFINIISYAKIEI